MKFRIYRNWWSSFYMAELLGGEFANCYGQGSSPESAISSLKIRVNQLRNNTRLQHSQSLFRRKQNA